MTVGILGSLSVLPHTGGVLRNRVQKAARRLRGSRRVPTRASRPSEGAVEGRPTLVLPRADFELTWDRLGANFEPTSGQPEADFGPTWNHFGPT